MSTLHDLLHPPENAGENGGKMMHAPDQDCSAPPRFSPLVLIDRLISLAEQADRAGMDSVAGRLVQLACTVGDETPN